jgi:hypothetical protein
MNTANNLKIAVTTATDPVTGRYQPKGDPSDMDRRNLDRVRAIIGLFGLSVAAVAKAGGVSRPYLSRALSGSLVPSPKFYRVLEGNLGRLVEGRHGQVFGVLVTDCRNSYVGRC